MRAAPDQGGRAQQPRPLRVASLNVGALRIAEGRTAACLEAARQLWAESQLTWRGVRTGDAPRERQDQAPGPAPLSPQRYWRAPSPVGIDRCGTLVVQLGPLYRWGGDPGPRQPPPARVQQDCQRAAAGHRSPGRQTPTNPTDAAALLAAAAAAQQLCRKPGVHR